MKCRYLVIGLSAVTAVACLGSGPQAKPDLAAKANGPVTVFIDELRSGAIPVKHTANGGNVSPTVSWSTVPAKTKSVALVVDDPDANGFVHWVVYNLSPETNKLPAAMPRTDRLNALGSAMQGKNGTGGIGYFGPKPPPGKPHHYHFRVYALDAMLPLKPGVTKANLISAMSGHVLSQGETVGIYQSG